MTRKLQKICSIVVLWGTFLPLPAKPVIGDTKNDILRKYGEPDGIMEIFDKEIFMYGNKKVTFEQDKILTIVTLQKSDRTTTRSLTASQQPMVRKSASASVTPTEFRGAWYSATQYRGFELHANNGRMTLTIDLRPDCYHRTKWFFYHIKHNHISETDYTRVVYKVRDEDFYSFVEFKSINNQEELELIIPMEDGHRNRYESREKAHDDKLIPERDLVHVRLYTYLWHHDDKSFIKPLESITAMDLTYLMKELWPAYQDLISEIRSSRVSTKDSYEAAIAYDDKFTALLKQMNYDPYLTNEERVGFQENLNELLETPRMKSMLRQYPYDRCFLEK